MISDQSRPCTSDQRTFCSIIPVRASPLAEMTPPATAALTVYPNCGSPGFVTFSWLYALRLTPSFLKSLLYLAGYGPDPAPPFAIE